MKLSFTPSAESVDILLEKYLEEKADLLAKKNNTPTLNNTPDDDDFMLGRPSALDELMALTGLDNVKSAIMRQINCHRIMKRREESGLKTPKRLMHMLLTGNPGTGKTTVARLIGRIYKEEGLLSSGHLIEANRASLVGQWIGESERKTTDLLNTAKGGILFIDEIYSLAESDGGNTSTRDFGMKVIDTLMPVLSNPDSDIMIIGAGYRQNICSFLQANPGLASRFPLTLDFPDFSVDELRKIVLNELATYDFSLTEDADELLPRLLNQCVTVKNHGNARMALNLVHNHLIPNLCDRMVDVPDSDIDLTGIITRNDFPSFDTLFPLNKFSSHIGFNL